MARLALSGAILLILFTKCSALALDQRENPNDYKQPHEDYGSVQNQQPVSPAFFAAILGELRALVHEEVAKDHQEHADHNDWNTKPFWITFGVNVALFAVGAVYSAVAWRQLAAIKRQADLQQIALQRDRPFLSIEELTLVNFKPQSDLTTITPLVIKFKLKNSGKTACPPLPVH
ncbi:MAG TPA: hypothetical protein VMS08_01155 [Candidatus Saccharimonadia bacterium]|nr:hypothetical protein [Candidatus Saccharimonadia bacterium]